MLERIEKVMNDRVRPYLRSHGGDAAVTDYADGKVVVRLSGQCVGCPSADMSTKYLIQDILCEEIPEIKEVVIDESVDPELLRQAREILFGARRDA